jgi:hypothetical protein
MSTTTATDRGAKCGRPRQRLLPRRCTRQTFPFPPAHIHICNGLANDLRADRMLLACASQRQRMETQVVDGAGNASARLGDQGQRVPVNTGVLRT